MPDYVVSRTQRICALCKHWNGSLGCTTIKPTKGAYSFHIDSSEHHPCFKPGVGIEKIALSTCQYFRPRYDD